MAPRTSKPINVSCGEKGLHTFTTKDEPNMEWRYEMYNKYNLKEENNWYIYSKCCGTWWCLEWWIYQKFEEKDLGKDNQENADWKKYILKATSLLRTGMVRKKNTNPVNKILMREFVQMDRNALEKRYHVKNAGTHSEAPRKDVPRGWYTGRTVKKQHTKMNGIIIVIFN